MSPHEHSTRITSGTRDPAAHLRLVLWRANKAVEAFENTRAKGRGLCLTDFGILEVLLHKGPLPVNTIGKKVLLSSGSITTAVKRLEEKGLVTRKTDGTDRRVSRVRLTPEGEAFIRKDYTLHLQQLRQVSGVLTEAEQEMLVDLLKKLGRRAEILAELVG